MIFRHILFVFIVMALCTVRADRRELRFLGLLPMTGNGWIGGASCLPAVQMAIEDVNARNNLLADYNLTYKWIDSKCDPGMAVYRMTEALHADPPYIMVLGDGCSTGSEATSQVSYFWNLTQFSYGSSSPILSDRNRFPHFFRIVSPDQKLNPARIELMRRFDWKKVATINQALEFFSVVIDDFVKRVHDTDITIISQEIFVGDPLTRIQNLKNRDARIIITAMYEDMARAALCAAYRVGLYGPKIVWVFVGWYSVNFWKTNLDDVACSEREMSIAADGAILTGAVFKNPVEERGIANLTVKEFEKRFYAYPTYSELSKGTDFVAYQCYDHIWIAAAALNCTVSNLRDIGHSKSLDMFTYKDSDINDIIFQCMGRSNLLGLTGRTVYTEGADPDRIIKLERIQGDERQIVGMYRQGNAPSYLDLIEDGIVWKDGNIPRDSTFITQLEIEIPAHLYMIMAILAALGICLTMSLFVFSLIYRNNRYVKMSSPNINNVLLLGCALCYCTVFFKTTEASSGLVCKARLFSFSLGFTLTFGALFSKTWRVYRIFTNNKLQKRAIKDFQLLAIIGVIVGFVIMVLILWESIGPHRMKKKFLPKEIYMLGNDAEVHPFVRVCESDYSAYFGWVLYIIQGALLSFGAFLAWETKHVKIVALNDSHQIGLCIYNVVILSAVGLTLTLLLEDQEVMMYGITSGCLIIGTTLTQVIIFVPKIHAVKNKVTDMDLSTMPPRTGTQLSGTATREVALPTSSWQPNDAVI